MPWCKGWTGCVAFGLPLRATGEPYRRVNVLMLWAQGHVKGYGSPTWMTYKQAQALGGQVRKGERSATVVKYGTYEAQVEFKPNWKAHGKGARFKAIDQMLDTYSPLGGVAIFGANGIALNLAQKAEAKGIKAMRVTEKPTQDGDAAR